MSDYTIREFIQKTMNKERQYETFGLENERTLRVELDDFIWTKMGSMIAYEGNIRFEREGLLEHGANRMLKKAFTNEGNELMKAKGQGILYLSDQGKKITILDLRGDQITVNGEDLLAFEPSIDWDIHMMRKIAGMMSGGLFNIGLKGNGKIAITTHFEPLTLVVERGKPVYTDPSATVAWSSNLKPEFKTDISYRTFLGRGSGESIQMAFEGEGFVIVQPYFEGN